MSSKAAKYGQARSGTGPTLDDADFALGQDPNYVKNFGEGAAGIGKIGRATSVDTARDVGEAARGAATVGQQSRESAADNRGQIAGVQSRVAPTTSYGASGAAVGRAQATGQDQASLAQRLEQFAAGPAPDSGAQAMLTQGTNDALNAQLALARSGSGFGESAASLGSAGRNAAAAVAAKANESARLKAQEGQAWQDQRLQAFGQAGDIYGADRAAALQEAGLLGEQAEYLTEADLRATEMNDAAALGWADAENAAYGTATQGFGTAADARAAEAAAYNDAYGLELDSWGMGLDAEKAALEGRMGQEQINSDIYQAELGHQTQMRDLDQKKSQGVVSGVMGGLAAAGGIAAMFSDEKLKTKIKERDDLGETYAALGGDEEEEKRSSERKKKVAGSLFSMAGDYANSMGRR